ncbi:MAG: hypothetical protein WC238_00015 [Parcubacteria group bacterium]
MPRSRKGICDVDKIRVSLGGWSKKDLLISEDISPAEFILRFTKVLKQFFRTIFPVNELTSEALENCSLPLKRENPLSVFGGDFVGCMFFWMPSDIVTEYFNSFLSEKLDEVIRKDVRCQIYKNVEALTGDPTRNNGPLKIGLYVIDDSRVIVRFQLGTTSGQITPLFPVKKVNGEWTVLEKHTLNFRGDDTYEFMGGSINLRLKPFESGWLDAIFATTSEEELAVVVKHYLLVPDDANPLTILLRSPQPTKGIAKQIENLLREAIL